MRRPLRLFTVRRRLHIAGGALALALLLAQALGVLHRYAHGAHGAAAPGTAVQLYDAAGAPHSPHDDGPSSHAAPRAHALVAALFDTHEDDSSECRLYDQLTHADALWTAAAAFASTLPNPGHVAVSAPAERGGIASWFLARAPPARA